MSMLIDIVSLNDAMKGVNFVYHCAAKVSLANYDKNQLYKTNIEGNRKCCKSLH